MKYAVTLTFTKRMTVEAEDKSDAINQAMHMGGAPRLTDSRAIPDRYSVKRRMAAIGRWERMAEYRKTHKLWQVAEKFGVTIRTVAKCLEKWEAAKLIHNPRFKTLVPALLPSRSQAGTERRTTTVARCAQG